MAGLLHGRSADAFAGAGPLDGVAIPSRAGPDEVARHLRDLPDTRFQNAPIEQTKRDIVAVLLDDEAVHPGFVTRSGQTGAILRAGPREGAR